MLAGVCLELADRIRFGNSGGYRPTAVLHEWPLPGRQIPLLWSCETPVLALLS